MHFRKPRRSTPSWLWSCKSSSCIFGGIVFRDIDSPCILGTPSAGAIFRRPSPPMFLEGGAGERVQGARAAYGTCFVCADRRGAPVIPGRLPSFGAYQAVVRFVTLKRQ